MGKARMILLLKGQEVSAWPFPAEIFHLWEGEPSNGASELQIAESIHRKGDVVQVDLWFTYAAGEQAASHGYCVLLGSCSRVPHPCTPPLYTPLDPCTHPNTHPSVPHPSILVPTCDPKDGFLGVNDPT